MEARMNIDYPPGPKGLPLLGNLLELRKDKMGFLSKLARTYGNLVHFRVGPRRAYFLNHPELIHEVLVEQSAKLPKEWMHQKIAAPFLGRGMLVSEGEHYKRQRRTAQPAFHPRRIEGYGRIFVEQALKGISGWRSGGDYEIDAEMLKISIQNVCLTMFGMDATGIAARAAGAMTDCLELFSTEFDISLPIPMWLPTEHNRRKRAAVKQLDEIVMSFADEWRKSREDKGDLLSMLMQSREGGGVTHDELRDHLINVFAAGHETTAFTLVWAWILLSGHPDVEAEVCRELDRVLGGRPPAAEDIPKLVYTSMIVKETLRLYSPGWLLSPREPVEDIILAGYTIPKGSMLFISPFLLHRDARFFPEPERFDPERFRPGTEKPIQRGAYIPFGVGPRVCIGNGFATTQVVLILATIIQQYRISILPGQQIVPRGTLALRPPPGVRVKVFARRDAQAAA
jgi:cytochrome P450